MKAVQLSDFGIENFHINEIAKPAPKSNEVLVNIKAVSLNFMDLRTANGSFSKDFSFPYIPGGDGAGVLEAVGAEVTHWKIGDRVAIQFSQNWIKGQIDNKSHAVRVGVEIAGVMAEYVCIPEHGLVKAPANLSFEETATLPIAALSAWHALMNQAKLRIGQTVLTQGTGGVSLFALQFAKAAGARVIATTSSVEKAKRLAILGADAVIDYSRNPNWHEEVLSLTDGEGADITLDVAGKNTIGQSLLSLKENGFLSTAGFLSGADLAMNIHGHKINMSSIRIQGFSVGSVESFSAMNRAIEINDIHPVIDTIFPIDRVKDAYYKLERGEHVGKIVISI
jgi:NADPH:quinone reductase-like Zn-dependent oxidoreductase